MTSVSHRDRAHAPTSERVSRDASLTFAVVPPDAEDLEDLAQRVPGVVHADLLLFGCGDPQQRGELRALSPDHLRQVVQPLVRQQSWWEETTERLSQGRTVPCDRCSQNWVGGGGG